MRSRHIMFLYWVRRRVPAINDMALGQVAGINLFMFWVGRRAWAIN